MKRMRSPDEDEIGAAGSVAVNDLKLARQFSKAEEHDAGLFRVVLFESRARGEADEESDLDLFVATKAWGSFRRSGDRAVPMVVDDSVPSREGMIRHG